MSCELHEDDPGLAHRRRGSVAARERRFAFLVGFVVCVGLPGFITAIAPVSWIKLERQDGKVVATAKTCVWFCFPYRTVVVRPLVGIDDRFIAGIPIERDAFGERYRSLNDRQRSEDEALLILHGPEAGVEVPVSPASIDAVKERCRTFLDNPQATEKRLFVVANWKFGIFIGGAMSLLTALYLAGCAWQIVKTTRQLGSRLRHYVRGT